MGQKFCITLNVKKIQYRSLYLKNCYPIDQPTYGVFRDPKLRFLGHFDELRKSSFKLVRGHPSLKSPRECLYHVHLPCQCPGGPYHTFVAIGATLRPKKRAQIRSNTPKLTRFAFVHAQLAQ